SSTSSEIQARLDALKKAGSPVTAQDLDRMYPPLPDDQNSVIVYQKAMARYAAPPANATYWPIIGDSKYRFRTQQLPPDVNQGIANYVNQNESALALLHQAAGIEKGYYDTGFSRGFSAIIPTPFMQIHENAQLLSLAAI